MPENRFCFFSISIVLHRVTLTLPQALGAPPLLADPAPLNLHHLSYLSHCFPLVEDLFWVDLRFCHQVPLLPWMKTLSCRLVQKLEALVAWMIRGKIPGKMRRTHEESDQSFYPGRCLWIPQGTRKIQEPDSGRRKELASSFLPPWHGLILSLGTQYDTSKDTNVGEDSEHHADLPRDDFP